MRSSARKGDLLVHLWHRCDGLYRVLLSPVADGQPDKGDVGRRNIRARVLSPANGHALRIYHSREPTVSCDFVWEDEED